MRWLAAAIVVLAAAAILAHGSHVPVAATRPTTLSSAARDEAHYLTMPDLAPGASCPVTRARRSDGYPLVLREVDPGHLRQWFGHGHVWVLPPQAGSAVRLPDGMISAKVPWFVAGPGTLRVVGRRIDGRPGTASASVPAFGAPIHGQVEPSSIVVPSLGCWLIAGIVGDHVLRWIYSPELARRA